MARSYRVDARIDRFADLAKRELGCGIMPNIERPTGTLGVWDEEDVM